MSCDLLPECKILDASGNVLAKLNNQDGEAYIQADVQLAKIRPKPQSKQPDSGIPWQTYFFSDTFLPFIMRPCTKQESRYGKENHKLNLSRSSSGSSSGYSHKYLDQNYRYH
jgi:hypothetical protein